MLKFYVKKRDESEGDGFTRIMEFDALSQFIRFAEYNRAYIEEIKTLDEDEKYLIEDSAGNRVQG